jgi:hypothetical protein
MFRTEVFPLPHGLAAAATALKRYGRFVRPVTLRVLGLDEACGDVGEEVLDELLRPREEPRVEIELAGRYLTGWRPKLLGLVLPGVGTAGDVLGKIGDAAKGAADLLEAKDTTSINSLRADVKKAFLSIGKRVVIVLDDLDRLRADEIRDIVRLVRLVADLPKLPSTMCCASALASAVLRDVRFLVAVAWW